MPVATIQYQHHAEQCDGAGRLMSGDGPGACIAFSPPSRTAHASETHAQLVDTHERLTQVELALAGLDHHFQSVGVELLH